MVLSHLHLELGKVVKSPLQDEEVFSGMWCFYYVESSFSNDDPERLKDYFEKISNDFVPEMSKYNNLSFFSYRCHRLGESNPSPSLKFWISEIPCLTHVFEIHILGKFKQISNK